MDNHENDSLYMCLICRAPISEDPEIAQEGLSMDDTDELHVCRVCWDVLSPLERLEQCRKWRLDRSVSWVCDELARICSKTDGSLPFQIPRPGHN